MRFDLKTKWNCFDFRKRYSATQRRVSIVTHATDDATDDATKTISCFQTNTTCDKLLKTFPNALVQQRYTADVTSS